MNVTRWRIAGLLVALALGVASSAALTQDAQRTVPKSDPPHELDAFVLDVMREWGVPGIAIAVVRDGRVEFAKGYGVREVGRPEPVGPDTVFGIGSMTKTFTAAAAAVLVDEGRLAWDRPVVEVLPGYRLSDPWITPRVTLRDVAAHRVGIDGDLLWMARSTPGRATLERAAHLGPSGRFGDFLYANTGTLALGLAVEAASGRSWDEVVSERLLGPLGMSRTSTREDAYVQRRDLALCWLCEPPPGARRGRAALIDPRFDAASPHGLAADRAMRPGESREVELWPWRYEPSITPAGAINSSVADIARWMQMHLGDGLFEGRRVLSVRQIRESHAFQALRPASAAADERARSAYERRYSLRGYGLGWTKAIYRGHDVSTHGGGQIGFGTTMWLVPSRGLGVVVMQNLDYRQSDATSAIVLRFVDHYLGLEPLDAREHLVRNWSPKYEGRELADELAKVRPSIDARALDRLPGRYHTPALGEVEVRRERERLVLAIEPGCVADLLPLDEHRFIAAFRATDHWLVHAEFVLDAEGRAQELRLGERALPDVYRLRRVNSPATTDAAPRANPLAAQRMEPAELYRRLLDFDALLSGSIVDARWEAASASAERERTTRDVVRYTLDEGPGFASRAMRMEAATGRVTSLQTAPPEQVRDDAEPRTIRTAFPSTLGPLRELPSPDGRHVLTLLDHDLALREVAGGATRRLSTGAAADHGYTTRGARWSADGRYVAALRIDERRVHPLAIARRVGATEQLQRVAYPQAGGAFAQPRLVVVERSTGRLVEVTSGDDDHFVAIVGFRAGGDELLFARMTRDHRRIDLLIADPRTGATRPILSETSATWLFGSEDVFAEARFVTVLADGRFIWASERDGWNHLYLYDRDGREPRALTRGNWPIVRVVHVDERAGRVHFLARPDAARLYDTHLMSVRLDGGGLRQLTTEPGNHEVALSRSGRYILDTHSALDRPPTVVLRAAATGAVLRVIGRADTSALDALGWRAPEELWVQAADGRTRLRALLYTPIGFDPTKRYPLVQYIYAGPFRSVAPNGFRTADTRIRFLQALVQLGCVGLVMDARGTPGRDKAFQDVAQRSFGEHELADHAAAVEQLAASRPWIDRERVGIFGISFGGYFAIRALAKRPDLYRSGAALAPAEVDAEVLGPAVEPFLGRPRENAAAYAAAANVPIVEGIRAPLLIAIGSSDVNTPIGQTLKIVSALQHAGREHELIVVPEANHVFRHEDGRSSLPYVFERVRAHFVATLGITADGSEARRVSKVE